MFEKILRMTGNTDIHFEIRKKGYSIRLRNKVDGVLSKNSILSHDKKFYNEFESYIDAPKNSIIAHLNKSDSIPLIETKTIHNKMIKVVHVPCYPIGNGCDIMIRLR
jgi:hypothetical protein